MEKLAAVFMCIYSPIFCAVIQKLSFIRLSFLLFAFTGSGASNKKTVYILLSYSNW